MTIDLDSDAGQWNTFSGKSAKAELAIPKWRATINFLMLLKLIYYFDP
jgi:hypothetical protein